MQAGAKLGDCLGLTEDMGNLPDGESEAKMRNGGEMKSQPRAVSTGAKAGALWHTSIFL
jgi:hypothetical protein